MFAVPGWAVSASLLAQERGGNKKRTPDQVSEDADKRQKRQKKRKRGSDHDGIANQISKPDNNRRLNVRNDDTDDNIASSKRHQRNQEDREVIEQVSSSKNEKDAARKRVGQKSRKLSNGAEQAVRKDTGRSMATSISARPLDTERKGSMGVSTKPPSSVQLTPLQAKMRSKLTSARFRHLNETLYTSTSSHALSLFTTSPDLFDDYHAGFSQQVKDSWPQNPVDQYIRLIKARGALSESKPGTPPLPRRKTQSCTIADLGCGDAPLARGCQAVTRALKLRFHSYDLHASNSLVTKADISQLPMRDGEADITVFCLSLMGTNWVSFVEEAWRVLRGDGKGEVWVAEVKSRFGRVTKGRVVDNSVGKRRKRQASKPGQDSDDDDEPEEFGQDERGADEPHDETDVSAFVKVFTRRGFQLRDGSIQRGNKMFVSMIFTKSGIPTAGKHKGLKWTGKEYQRQQDPKPRFVGGQKDEDELTPEQEAKVLKPCLYKTR